VTLRFGTDGIRGRETDLTPELVVAMGRAAAVALDLGPGARVVIGRDTRRSGPMIESALAAGLAAEGLHVERLGVIPTPGVAWVSATSHVAGAMISASHNVFSDNGIKLFGPGGHKLSDDAEARLEQRLDALVAAGAEIGSADGSGVGTVVDRPQAAAGYGDHLLAAALGDRRLDGLGIVVDPAHGAASSIGPAVLTAAGADVRVIHAEPDGVNINAGCGSTHPAALRLAVVDGHADLGLALDGDADRVLAVDHRGELVDGDQLLAVLALDLKQRERLRANTVVVTVMANLGLRRAMAEHGISVVETPVGDRHVLAALEAGGWSLGGEQSGHVILRDLATTGDGLLTGLAVADVVRRSGQPLATLATSAMTRLPQVLRAVPVARRPPDIAAAVAEDLAAAESELGDTGRVVLRPSGTEPVVRVMVEAPTRDQAEQVGERLARAVERAASLS
jgi:phosphoglucosamine mutase